MPIKDPSIYPPYWKQFSEWVRFERAKNKCERCEAPNGKFINRGRYAGNAIWHDPDNGIFRSALTGKVLGRARDYELDITRETRVVLTVAHLDDEGGVCQCKATTGLKCAKPSHVLALCQACHLRMDLPKHIENRRQTTIERNDAGRGLFQ